MLLENLTSERVWNLSEEEAFELIKIVQSDIKKEERPRYMQIIGTAFELRSISPKRRDLKLDLTRYGYKFFQVENNKNLLTGIYKRKKG